MRHAGAVCRRIFHGITAVAELKVPFGPDHTPDPSHFPRHHRRGRIEGLFRDRPPNTIPEIFHGITAVAELKALRAKMSALIRVAIFHGITAVAELKATCPRCWPRPCSNFPRHHRRGRIEGLHPRCAGFDFGQIFHGINAVAELKRTISPCWRVGGVGFSTSSPPWPN